MSDYSGGRKKLQVQSWLFYVDLVFGLALEGAWKVVLESFWGLTFNANTEQFVFISSCCNLFFPWFFCLFVWGEEFWDFITIIRLYGIYIHFNQPGKWTAKSVQKKEPVSRVQLRKGNDSLLKGEENKGKCPFPCEWIITVIWFILIVGKGWAEDDYQVLSPMSR